MNFLCFSLSELSSFFPFNSERQPCWAECSSSQLSFLQHFIPLACEASAESSADGLMGFSLCVAGFLLAVFRILALAFVIFNTSCRGSLGSSCLDLSVLTGPGCSFGYFFKSAFCPAFSSGIPIMVMCLTLSQGSLNYRHFFFYFCSSDWVISTHSVSQVTNPIFCI